MPLLNSSLLFQTLLNQDKPAGSTVMADLDADSFEDIPAIIHSSIIAQGGNADGLWTVTLTVNVILEAAGAFDVVSHVYDQIRAWNDDPESGVLPGVGGVETVEDLDAFTTRTGETQMTNKVVRQYTGTFNVTVRSL